MIMPDSEADILLRYPPRPLDPIERDLVAQWLSLAGDISSAYVSTRQEDDPALYRRVVITVSPDGHPTQTVHAPAGKQLWVKLTLGPEPITEFFDSLATALNSIRRVLP